MQVPERRVIPALQRAVDRLAERRALRANDRKRRRRLARWHRRAVTVAEGWRPAPADQLIADDANPLRAFLAARSEGRGVWKWDHYMDIYHRHFERFRGEEIHILEIGIYSGGSLDMWHDYFGPKCHVYGVDIQEECLSYAGDRTTILIGDQADPHFWRDVRRAVPRLDIVVDDGGHLPEQQAVSAEELLPHVQPGGLYVVEDVHGVGNPFAAYVYGWVQALNTFRAVPHPGEPERRMVSETAAFQASIEGIYQYPYVVVVEKRAAALDGFVAPKRGSEWAPFLRND